MFAHTAPVLQRLEAAALFQVIAREVPKIDLAMWSMEDINQLIDHIRETVDSTKLHHREQVMMANLLRSLEEKTRPIIMDDEFQGRKKRTIRKRKSVRRKRNSLGQFI